MYKTKLDLFIEVSYGKCIRLNCDLFIEVSYGKCIRLNWIYLLKSLMVSV